MQALFDQRGTMAKVAKHLAIADAGSWVRVPLEYVFIVAKISSLPPEQLRPDFFAHDPLRKQAAYHFYRPGKGRGSLSLGAPPTPMKRRELKKAIQNKRPKHQRADESSDAGQRGSLCADVPEHAISPVSETAT